MCFERETKLKIIVFPMNRGPLICEYIKIVFPGSFTPSAGEPKKDQCNKTVEIYEDVSSPEVTEANFGKPMTCWYRFRSFRGTPKDWILRIKFNKFKIGNLLNATHCEGGYLQVSQCA
ncbi:unnamed protein product [Phyllotreta striolata]|uniref:CUB domain-containing protein n=1 Tax=Phyllotreta striolata TaxID=444603 RepID=A0A9N9TZW1_PHYSR|nr:unnamed protein product [Phyllotreta striolata]